VLIILRDGHAAAEAEGAAGDFNAGGGLAALVFAAVDEANDAHDRRGVEAFIDDLGGAFFLLHISEEDRVEQFIRWKGVLVGLVGAEFGAGDFVDAGLGDERAAGAGVDPAGHFPDLGFGEVTDEGEAAAHVAVEGAVADGEFAFVAGGQEQMAEFVAEGHEDSAADAGLEIFFSYIGSAAGEGFGEGFFVGRVDLFDGDDVKFDGEIFRQ